MTSLALRDEDGRTRIAEQGEEPDGEAALPQGPDQGRAQEGRRRPPLPEAPARQEGRQDNLQQEVGLESNAYGRMGVK